MRLHAQGGLGAVSKGVGHTSLMSCWMVVTCIRACIATAVLGWHAARCGVWWATFHHQKSPHDANTGWRSCAASVVVVWSSMYIYRCSTGCVSEHYPTTPCGGRSLHVSVLPAWCMTSRLSMRSKTDGTSGIGVVHMSAVQSPVLDDLMRWVCPLPRDP